MYVKVLFHTVGYSIDFLLEIDSVKFSIIRIFRSPNNNIDLFLTNLENYFEQI